MAKEIKEESIIRYTSLSLALLGLSLLAVSLFMPALSTGFPFYGWMVLPLYPFYTITICSMFIIYQIKTKQPFEKSLKFYEWFVVVVIIITGTVFNLIWFSPIFQSEMSMWLRGVTSPEVARVRAVFVCILLWWPCFILLLIKWKYRKKRPLQFFARTIWISHITGSLVGVIFLAGERIKCAGWTLIISMIIIALYGILSERIYEKNEGS